MHPDRKILLLQWLFSILALCSSIVFCIWAFTIEHAGRFHVITLSSVGLLGLMGMISAIYFGQRHNSTQLKQAEDKLGQLEEENTNERKKVLQQESLFRNLFNGSPIPMIWMDFAADVEHELREGFSKLLGQIDEIDAGEALTSGNFEKNLRKGRIHSLNDAAMGLLGVTRKKVDDGDCGWLMECVDATFKLALVRLLARERRLSNFECNVIPVHGSKIRAMVDFAVLSHNFKEESIVISIQDVTEQRKEHEALIKAKDIAEEANHFKSTFLANMSHELKTPLNAIIGFSELMEGTVKSDEYREPLKLIKDSGRHLLGIVKDILELTHMDIEKEHLNFSLFGIEEFVGDFLHPYKDVAANKNLDLQYFVSCPNGSSGFLFCDQPKIHHVLTNLVDNSLKFTDEGKINIGAKVEHLGDDWFGHLDRSNPLLKNEVTRVISQEFEYPEEAILCRVQIVVSDSGIGIPEERKERIFEPFVQGDSSSTRKFGGAGLGLTVCRKLVKSLEGDIVCKNLDGGGSEFVVDFLAVGSMNGKL